MKEQLISFETAKLAKEKGYPQNANYTSWYNEFGVENGRTDLDKDGKPYEGRFIPLQLKEKYKRQSFLAPTQSLFQKWLREVHNIDVLPERCLRGYNYCIRYNFGTIANKTIYQEGYCEKFEEALEKGLQGALKSIKTE